jgi:hypothetical protein
MPLRALLVLLLVGTPLVSHAQSLRSLSELNRAEFGVEREAKERDWTKVFTRTGALARNRTATLQIEMAASPEGSIVVLCDEECIFGFEVFEGTRRLGGKTTAIRSTNLNFTNIGYGTARVEVTVHSCTTGTCGYRVLVYSKV